MQIIVNNVFLSLNEKEDNLYAKVSKILHLKETDIANIQIIKKAVDARKKNNILFVYSFLVETKRDFKILNNNVKISDFKETIDILPIIWENILMEIPTHVVSPDASGTELEGEGWSLNKEVKTGNSELSKLKDLL